MNRSIVINREFGSGGREVGRMISERTGLDFYDTRIFQDAATRRGVPANQLTDFDERLVAGQYLNLSFSRFNDPELAALPHRTFQAIAEVITEAARTAPAVFIGRCADVILHEAGVPIRSVFIYNTDTAAKIARAVEIDGVAARDAEKYIARMDRARSRYQAFYTGTHFGDHRQYDLCLNSAQLGYRACADAILATLDEKAQPADVPPAAD